MRAHRIIPAVGTGALLLALPLLLNACGDTGSASPELGATGIANAALAGTWEFNKALSDCPDSAPPPDSLRTPPGGMGWHGPGGPGDMMHHGGHGGPGMGGGLGMFACLRTRPCR